MTSQGSERTAELCALGVAELGRLYRTGELSPVEVTQATLERIARLNPELNAYLTVLEESALAAAKAAELQLAAGIDLGPMHGVPVSVKDIIRIRGTRTTAASRVLHDAPLDDEDAEVVRRLRRGGAILVGKVNLHEFAYGDPDPAGPFGLVQNPRRIGHQSGSSSSGSGSAVAAGLGVVSLGTDTGGSIRHPASVCGVVGLKPTYGRVPVRGVIPLSAHLDHVGPLGRSVADVAAALAAIAGYDPGDPHAAREATSDYVGALQQDLRGLRLGLPTNAFYRFGQPPALAAREQAGQALVDAGLLPVHVEVPRADEAGDLTTTISTVDLWDYHEQYLAREDLYGRDFRKRAWPGREISGMQYARARATQAAMRHAWVRLFEQVDVLVLPANVAGAPRHGQETIEVDGQAHPARSTNSRSNRGANITGFPALVVPVGEMPDGLPVAVQLVGAPFGEARLLAIGHALEQATGRMAARWGIEPRRG